MKVRHVVQRIHCRVDIPFTYDETNHFRTFLKATGRKAGPWVRALIIRAMEVDRDGSQTLRGRAVPDLTAGQAREAAAALSESRTEQ